MTTCWRCGMVTDEVEPIPVTNEHGPVTAYICRYCIDDLTRNGDDR